MGREEFWRLYLGLMRATPKEHRVWLRGKVRFGNEPSFTKRLRLLARDSGPVGKVLLGDRDKWAYLISSVRNELTHLGFRRERIESGDLYWLADSVYVLVCVCLLRYCGVPQEGPASSWVTDR
jgi:hypothetical protein